METVKIKITSVARLNTRSEKSWEHADFEEEFETEALALDFLVTRYRKFNPKTLQKVYRGEGTPIGYLKSYWGEDYDNDPYKPRNLFITDWIEVTKLVETPVLF